MLDAISVFEAISHSRASVPRLIPGESLGVGLVTHPQLRATVVSWYGEIDPRMYEIVGRSVAWSHGFLYPCVPRPVLSGG